MLGWPKAGELAHALAEATNDWLVAEWLDRDRRLFASIIGPTDDPARAAAQIRRAAADHRFVQVLLTTGTKDPLGHPPYLPAYSAAEGASPPRADQLRGFTGDPAWSR